MDFCYLAEYRILLHFYIITELMKHIISTEWKVIGYLAKRVKRTQGCLSIHALKPNVFVFQKYDASDSNVQSSWSETAPCWFAKWFGYLVLEHKRSFEDSWYLRRIKIKFDNLTCFLYIVMSVTRLSSK